ncbi:hypothetical protein DES49_0219 [Halospina denitrificans]|uniref:Uncharacterized protein n=1 Tax=Halospina denitrificans TaxID=332522 RepID=A0A4R7JZY6_9GAMM|nr:hypothetical protein [Halospina denitrificans]TDT44120.1 hypothetical protein DES49_0219 [Halospina denitrificans]
MKMPDCFEAYRILPLLAAVLLVAGCDSGVSTGGSNNSCTSGFSQPSGFEQEFNTFTIGEDTTQNPVGATLDKTMFRQFFLASRPADDEPNDDARNLYEFMVSETDAFADLDEAFVDKPIDKDDDGQPTEYQSVRNGFDLFEAMIIASEQFESLQTARDAMASCARDTQQAFAEDEDALPGSIVVRNIRVKQEGEEPDEWGFQVNYAHNPEPLDFATPFGANVGRVLFTPDSFVRTLYDYEDFTGSGAASGFKQPAVLVAGFNASLNDNDKNKDRASIVFESFPLDDTQDDRGQERGETDRWSWSLEEGTDQFVVNEGDEPDRCIRVTIDYSDETSSERINVQFSKETCPRITETEEFKKNREFSYTPENPDVSQTR